MEEEGREEQGAEGMTINREVFYNAYRSVFGGVTQRQVDGINTLLAMMEQDTEVQDSRYFAYMMATTKHETGDTFHPINEWGKGKGRKYGVADAETGFVYYGRGYVQLTWKVNYKVFGIERDPERALEPTTAYKVMSDGMRTGIFTGKSLAEYIQNGKCDYYNARRVINSLDCAPKIATYAVAFEKIFSLSMGGAA